MQPTVARLIMSVKRACLHVEACCPNNGQESQRACTLLAPAKSRVSLLRTHFCSFKGRHLFPKHSLKIGLVLSLRLDYPFKLQPPHPHWACHTSCCLCVGGDLLHIGHKMCRKIFRDVFGGAGLVSLICVPHVGKQQQAMRLHVSRLLCLLRR